MAPHRLPFALRLTASESSLAQCVPEVAHDSRARCLRATCCLFVSVILIVHEPFSPTKLGCFFGRIYGLRVLDAAGQQTVFHSLSGSLCYQLRSDRTLTVISFVIEGNFTAPGKRTAADA